MKNTKLAVAIMAGALGLAVQAHAQLYDITFSGGGVSVSGNVTLDPSGLATIGSFTVTGGPDPGTFNLAPVNFSNANGDNLQNDNLVMTSTPSAFLDNDGLGFGTANSGYALWYNGGGVYELWGYDYIPPYTEHGGADSGYGIVDVTGSATLVAVPEPTTMIAGALLLLPFGASTIRVLRRNRAA